MNYLQKRKLRRVCRYARKHAKNFIIKTLCVVNAFSLLFWMCLIDSIISWQPVAIMAVNIIFLYLVLYANGWIYGTEPYFQKLEKEGEQE